MHVDKQKTNIKIYISQFHKQEFVQFEILKKNILKKSLRKLFYLLEIDF